MTWQVHEREGQGLAAEVVIEFTKAIVFGYYLFVGLTNLVKGAIFKMCGLFGYFSFSQNSNISEKLVEETISDLLHRDPGDICFTHWLPK